MHSAYKPAQVEDKTVKFVCLVFKSSSQYYSAVQHIRQSDAFTNRSAIIVVIKIRLLVVIVLF